MSNSKALARALASIFLSSCAAHAEPFSVYEQTLPPASSSGSVDSLWIFQDGRPKKIDVGTLARSLGLILPSVELDMANNIALGASCPTIASCISLETPAGYAQWVDGHWSSFGPNTPRMTDKGLLIEGPSENIALYSRDMTNAVWVKSNTTATKTAVGIDNGSSTDASVITATAPYGTVCQSITATSSPFNEFVYSAFVKRVSGVGEIDIAVNYAIGQTSPEWLNISSGAQALTAAYQRYSLAYDNLSNPQVCVRVVTPGDSVAVDFNQVQRQVGATSPLATTSAAVTRAGDIISFSGGAQAVLNGAAATTVLSTGGMPAWQFRHQSNPLAPTPTFSQSNGETYGWQYTAGAIFEGKSTTGLFGDPPFSICGSTAALDANQSLALPNRIGFGWDATTIAMDCDGGGTLVGLASPPSGNFYIGNGSSSAYYYLSDVKIFPTKLSPANLQTATAYTDNKAVITDQVPASGHWGNFTPAAGFPLGIGGTDPVFTGSPLQNDYGIESGPGIGGVTSPIQTGASGNVMRFNLFANNCWVTDVCEIGGTGGSERSEMDGAIGAGGNAQWLDGQEVWISYSFCVEPGSPTTSNWFITGQVHQVYEAASGGNSPPLLITGKIGEFRQIGFVTDGDQGSQTFYEWPINRGVWEHMVIDMIMDPSGATGKVKFWKNGQLIVNYTGITGMAKAGGGTNGYYWKFGLYRSQVPEYAAVRYANMTITIAGASLVSKVATPDPIPSGYGTTCQ